MSRHQVAVVGAGPVGLLTALRLGQEGIKTLVIERHREILPTTRAVVYQPVVLPALKQLGIMSHVLQNSYHNHEGIYWRNEQGEALARLPIGTDSPAASGAVDGTGSPEQFNGIMLLGQQRLAKLILEELEKLPSVEVWWGVNVEKVENPPTGNTSKPVQIHAKQRDTGEGHIFEADYVLGTDGANSTVRQSMGVEFEGFTWEKFKMIGADILHDFRSSNGYPPMNFIVHPEKWAIIVSCGQDEHGAPHGDGTPLWRVAFAVPQDTCESQEEILRVCHERIAEYVSGATADKINISRAEPYTMHQRCAAAAHQGRVFLAGDALHSNNPVGGLGLTTGIVDACCYGNAFVRVLKNGEGAELLTKCAEERRKVWLEVTNPLSIRAIKRLMSDDADDVKERDGFLDALRREPEKTARGFSGMVEKLGADLFDGGAHLSNGVTSH